MPSPVRSSRPAPVPPGPGLLCQAPFTRAEAVELELRILETLASSSLADIPWPLIQADQVFAILRGEDARPSAFQLRAALKLGYSPVMSAALHRRRDSLLQRRA